MLKLIFIICISSVIATLVPNYEIHPAVVASCDVFNRGGLTCSDCNTLTRCVLMESVWESYVADKCDTQQGFYCNSFEEQCSQSPGPCNRLAEFGCSEEGHFPNPFTCQEYYVCLRVSEVTEIVAFPRYCDSGTAYSVSTEECTLRIDNPTCLQLQWKCNYAGDVGLWPGSEDIFYLCLRHPTTNELVPELHKCVNDQIFDGTDCIARNGGTSTPSTTAGTGSTESSTEGGVTPTQPPQFTCVTPGLFPNPNDCTQYFECDSSLTANLHSCPNGTYFVPESYACVWGTC